MIRNTLAVIAGLAVGMAVNMALILLNAYVLFPMPAGTSMQDPEQFNAYIATLPTAAFLVVLAAHLGQSFVGGWTAARIGSSRPMLLSMVVGVLSLVGGILNMMTVEGPAWMVVELPLYLVVAWLAGRIEVERRAAAPPRA
jgi:nitrate/nitrite transporter NarK